MTGERSSRPSASGRSAISRDSPWTHIAWMQALDLDLRAALRLERRGRPRVRRGTGLPGHEGCSPEGGIPDRPGRGGTRSVELRERARAGLRRAAGRRPGFVALALRCCTPVAALVATEPAIVHAFTAFLASGAPGPRRGRAGRPPPDRLPPLARRPPARARAAAVDRPVLVPPRGRAGEPGVVALSGCRTGRSSASSGRCWRGTCSRWCACSAPARWRCSGCASSGSRRFAAAAGGLVYEIAPYRLVQSRGHLLGPISLLLPLALWAFERARKTGDQRWWWASRAALVSIPLSGQVHLALGAIPFYVLYGICRSREARVVFETVLGAVAAILAGVLIDSDGDQRLDRRGRPLAEGGERLLRNRDRPRLAPRRRQRGGIRLPRLADPAARDRRASSCSRGGTRWLASALGDRRASSRSCSRFGTHNPLYGPLWHAFPPLRYPRVPERLMPIACLAMAAFVAFAIDWGLKRREARQLPQLALAAIVAVVLLADLHVRAFGASAADGENAAYDAVRDGAEGPSRRAARLPPGHPLRKRLPLLRPARAARAAARLLDDGARSAPTSSPGTSSR